MTYTVAEAERILAEAKAREAAVDPLLIEAREVCARFYEADGSPIIAADHRAGKFDDDDSQQTIALAALRRGMELVQPSPAPSEEDDLLLARDVIREWLDVEPENKGHVGLLVLAAIRAERKRAGGVKATAAFIAAMGAAAEALEEAIVWDGYDDDDVPAVWLNQADTALTDLRTHIENAKGGEEEE